MERGNGAVLNGTVTEGSPGTLSGGLSRALAPFLFFVFLFRLFAWDCETERRASPRRERELCAGAVVIVTLLSVSEGSSQFTGKVMPWSQTGSCHWGPGVLTGWCLCGVPCVTKGASLPPCAPGSLPSPACLSGVF